MTIKNDFFQKYQVSHLVGTQVWSDLNHNDDYNNNNNDINDANDINRDNKEEVGNE